VISPSDHNSPAIAPQPSFQLVADVLRRRIALGVYTPDHPLPSERQLAEVFGVGRSTVRAAVRLLAQEGLVVTTRGRWGGTVVTEGGRGPRDFDLAAGDLVHEVREVFQFRLLVEPAAAALAAEQSTPDERENLVRLAGHRPDNVASYRALDSRFHLAIGAMAGNRLLQGSIEAARADFFIWADAFFDTEWHPQLNAARLSQRQHQRIADAICEQNSTLAASAMRAHLKAAVDVFDRIVSAAARPKITSGRGRPTAPHDPADRISSRQSHNSSWSDKRPR
jgi:DNA-binding FadR family transcriptional regulator